MYETLLYGNYFWVVNEILEILKQRLPQLYSQGYAYDLGLLQVGKDLPTVTNLMQQALNLALK